MGAVRILTPLDGPVDRGELGAQGLRPARLRAGRRGRRRPAVRCADRARGRHAGGVVPPLPGRHRRASACWRPTWSTSTSRPSTSGCRSSTRPRSEERFAGLEEPGTRAAEERRHRGGRHGRSSASPTAATSARATSCASTCASGAIDDEWVGEDHRATSTTAHEREYSRRFEGVGHRDPEHPRARHRADAAAGDAGGRARATSRPDAALRHEREAWFRVDGELPEVATSFYDRASLRAGNRIEGPAVDRPVRLDHGGPARAWQRTIDRFGNIVIGIASSRGTLGAAGATAARTEQERDDVSRRLRGRPEARPADAPRVEVDPITLRVLGGAFHAIAKEMAGVLFRMSYSSIIRESEDLGAGIFDAAGPRALRVRLDADAHRLAALVHPRLPRPARGRDRGGRRDHPQPPLPRRLPFARTWRSRCRSSTRASCSASRP